MQLSNERRPVFLVYKCMRSTEVRGMRKNDTDGCGMWSIKKTRLDTRFWERPIQANCKFCGRRPRLNPANTMRFDCEEMAQEYRRKMQINDPDPRFAPLPPIEEEDDDDKGDWLS